MGEAKRMWEEELEELKVSHEREMVTLRDKMKKEKTVASSTTTEQLADLERELEDQWRGRAERQVSSVEERWRRKMEEVKEEKNSLEEQLREASAKVCVCVSICVCQSVCVNVCVSIVCVNL